LHQGTHDQAPAALVNGRLYRAASAFLREASLTEPKSPVFTGGCQCGAVRYALTAPPERVHLCHCRDCQKAVGGPFAALAPVRRQDFAWTRGVPGSFASSSIAHRGFCTDCGTPLSFSYDSNEWISVTIGSLDRPQDARPTKHMGVQSRLSWLDTLGELPVETTDAAMSAEHRQKYANYQHPNHDTMADGVPRR
jgi:hypothetical protein